MAGNVAENIKEIQKTNKITDQKNVKETKGRHENVILMRSKLFLLTFDQYLFNEHSLKDLPPEPSVQDIEENSERFGEKIDFSNYEGEHGVDRIVFLFQNVYYHEESRFIRKKFQKGKFRNSNIHT